MLACQFRLQGMLALKLVENLRSDPGRWKPDVAIFRPPVERLSINEIRGSKSCKPSEEEANGRRSAECV